MSSYGSIVRRQFLKKKLAVAGLLVVGLLFFLAVFSPFLAGNRPLVFDDGGGLSYPVLKAFSVEDFLWLASFALVLVSLLPGVMKRRPRMKKFLIALLFVATVVVS